ncbi:hypothetical protein L226DRAFT_535202 [Lentinus tigrinus ALCF2SS1-7]|uniref:uncharacterized protein n=1 Tax=Lentinus tigrinus ALCF2SS1-7 TaxID=1328758 RepID=UPI001166035A|nr:hypothetical protein L226DRAFT_535202 [Lentinus tigrinus ALCF2SS1-7]
MRLRLPEKNKVERIQEASIPSLPPDVLFWPDPSLRMITIAISDFATTSSNPRTRVGLLIPYDTFRALLAEPATFRGRIPWNVWSSRGSLLLSMPSFSQRSRRSLPSSHSFGSRLAVPFQSYTWLPGTVAVIDINPYGARYSRHPLLRGTWQAKVPPDSNLKLLFGTEDAALPHVIYHVGGHGVHGTGAVVADPYGFTTAGSFERHYKGIKTYSLDFAVEGLWLPQVV